MSSILRKGPSGPPAFEGLLLPGGTVRVDSDGELESVPGTAPGQLWYWNGSIWLPTTAPSDGQSPVWNAGNNAYDFQAAVPATALPLSVYARSSNTPGPPAFNSAVPGVGVVFREAAGTIGWGVITGLAIANNALDPTKMALSASSMAVAVWLGPFTLSPGTPGAPDDVVLYNANLPFGVRIVDCLLLVVTPIVGSTVQLRTATGGGGSGLTSAIPSAVAGTSRNNDLATRTVGINGTISARRSDAGVGAQVMISVMKI